MADNLAVSQAEAEALEAEGALPRLRVASFNVNTRALRYGNAATIRTICNALAQQSSSLIPEETDVVCLQEVWSASTARAIVEAGRAGKFAHAFHFTNGAMGSGLVTLSAHPIDFALFQPYSCWGHALAISAEVVAGNGVGYSRLRMPWGWAHVFNTRWASRSDPRKSDDDVHTGARSACAWECAHFCRQCVAAGGGGPAVLLGDLAVSSDSTEFQLLASLVPVFGAASTADSLFDGDDDDAEVAAAPLDVPHACVLGVGACGRFADANTVSLPANVWRPDGLAATLTVGAAPRLKGAAAEATELVINNGSSGEVLDPSATKHALGVAMKSLEASERRATFFTNAARRICFLLFFGGPALAIVAACDRIELYSSRVCVTPLFATERLAFAVGGAALWFVAGLLFATALFVLSSEMRALAQRRAEFVTKAAALDLAPTDAVQQSTAADAALDLDGTIIAAKREARKLRAERDVLLAKMKEMNQAVRRLSPALGRTIGRTAEMSA